VLTQYSSEAKLFFIALTREIGLSQNLTSARRECGVFCAAFSAFAWQHKPDRIFAEEFAAGHAPLNFVFRTSRFNDFSK